jgi:hypothetical protein
MTDNIELDELVVLDVSDDALELAAGGNKALRTPGVWPSRGCQYGGA